MWPYEGKERLTVEEFRWKTPVVVAEFIILWVLFATIPQTEYMQQSIPIMEYPLPAKILVLGFPGLFAVAFLLAGPTYIHKSYVEEDAAKARGWLLRGISTFSVGIAVVVAISSATIFF